MRLLKIMKLTSALIIIFLSLAADVGALDLIKKKTFHDKHSIGVRVGSYINTSDEKPPDDADFNLSFGSSSMYAEFFYAHRLIEPIALEFSMTIFKRGDVSYNRETGLIDRAVMIYPFWLSAKVYPFFKIKSGIHLFLQPGMGLIYGRRDIIDPYLVDANFEPFTSTESRTRLSYLLGAGVDYQVSDIIALTTAVKYLPSDFKEPLAGVEDYTGWTIAFGICYLWK